MSKQRVNSILVSNIANHIKQLREDKGISQEVFYIDTDIHIGRIESGKGNITVSTLSAICDYLGITLSDFFKDLWYSSDKNFLNIEQLIQLWAKLCYD